MPTASSGDSPTNDVSDHHASDNAHHDHSADIDQGNEWDEHAEGWDGDPYARAYAAAASSSLQEAAQRAGVALDGARVIDFGCGTGLLTERLVELGATITALDTSVAMLEVLEAKIAEQRWSRVTTGSDLPARGEAWDVVACSSVCSFLEDYPRMVDDLVARLRPGGLFIQWDWERTGSDPHGLAVEEIRSALGRAGLVEITVATAFEVEVEGDTMVPLVGYGIRPAD